MVKANQQPHKRFQWAKNRRYFAAWMTKDIWEWYFDHVLGKEKGGRSIKLLICAGPQTLISIARCACNWQRQFDAGFPAPLKLIGAACEPIFSAVGAEKVDAMQRIHGYYQPYSNFKRGVWNPRAPLITELKRKLLTGWERLQRKHEMLQLPELSYLLPSDPNLRKWVEKIAEERISEGRRPFDCVLSGPNRSWIPYWMRQTALEASYPDETRPISGGKCKRKLHTVRIEFLEREVEELTYGFAWGFHPTGADTSRFGYGAHVGRDALRKIVDDRLEFAHGAMMGLGPEQMDDVRLLDLVGPLTKIDTEYPPRKRTNEEIHANCLAAARWYAKQVPNLLFGRSPEYAGFAQILVERIFVAYHAWKQGKLIL